MEKRLEIFLMALLVVLGIVGFYFAISERVMFGPESRRIDTLAGELEVIIYEDIDRELVMDVKYFLESEGRRYEMFIDGSPRLISGSVEVSGILNDKIGELYVDVGDIVYVDGPMELEVSTGEIGTLVVLFNFQDDQTEPVTQSEIEEYLFNPENPESMNSYIQEYSYGTAWLTSTYFGWYTLPMNQEDCWDWLMQIDNVIDVVDSEVDFTTIDRIIIMHVDQFENNDYICGAGGAQIGMRSVETDEGIVEISWFNSRIKHDGVFNIVGNYIHESGHNFGFWHTNDLECGEEVVSNEGCSSIERGNKYTVMGSSGLKGHVDSFYKESVGWFDNNIVEVSGGSEVYHLYPLELPISNIQMIKIPAVYNVVFNDDESMNYFIEYRRPIGADASFSQLDDPTSGLMIYLDSDSRIKSHLLDMSPSMTSEDYSQADDSWDSFLRLGESYYDVVNDISITFSDVTEDYAIVEVSLSSLCVGDLNYDGFVDAADLSIILSRWGPNPGNYADLNQDGFVDAADLSMLLSAWGQCS
jgi:hypothetical protein